jgi:hypothetical protein
MGLVTCAAREIAQFSSVVSAGLALTTDSLAPCLVNLSVDESANEAYVRTMSETSSEIVDSKNSEDLS